MLKSPRAPTRASERNRNKGVDLAETLHWTDCSLAFVECVQEKKTTTRTALQTSLLFLALSHHHRSSVPGFSTLLLQTGRLPVLATCLAAPPSRHSSSPSFQIGPPGSAFSHFLTKHPRHREPRLPLQHLWRGSEASTPSASAGALGAIGVRRPPSLYPLAWTWSILVHPIPTSVLRSSSHPPPTSPGLLTPVHQQSLLVAADSASPSSTCPRPLAPLPILLQPTRSKPASWKGTRPRQSRPWGIGPSTSPSICSKAGRLAWKTMTVGNGNPIPLAMGDCLRLSTQW